MLGSVVGSEMCIRVMVIQHVSLKLVSGVGSAHATYELKMYLLDYLVEASNRFNWLRISIHVDDFSLFVKGSSDDE